MNERPLSEDENEKESASYSTKCRLVRERENAFVRQQTNADEME